MPTRNTPVFNQIIEALGDLLISSPHALARLERHFECFLIVVGGDINLVAHHAEQLRLAITTDECGLVLDHLARQIRITMNQTENAINTLFKGRFIERAKISASIHPRD